MAKYRVVCSKCGEALDVSDDCKCAKCGADIVIPRGGMLQIYRMGNFIGSAAAFGIYINEIPYGRMANRQTCCIPLAFGQYKIHITCGMNRRCNDPVITLTPENPISYQKVHIKMGAFSNTQVVEPAAPNEMPPVEE